MKKITVSINPSYFCNFRCRFCYLTPEQLGDQKRIDLRDLDRLLEEITKHREIDWIDLYGGEIGALKKNLENEGFSSLISLPLLTRGQDEVFFKNHPLEADSPTVFEHTWEVVCENNSLFCQINFEIFDKEGFEKIILGAFGAEEEDEGDIDFL